MIKKLFSKKATPVNFIKELYEKNINERTLESMLKDNNFDIDHQDENGNSFLHLCILNNKFQSAKWLIEKSGINLLSQNNKQQDTLELAVEKNNYRIVDLLLKTNKLNINELDSDQRSLLQNAVISGNKESALKLIQNNIDVNNIDNNKRNVIFDAISYGDDDFTDKVLEIENLELNNIDIKGETILHKQTTLENEELCIKLLKKGADPTICDAYGNNFLYHCATQGMEGSKLLDIALEHGCNINAKVKNNNSVLMETLKVFYKISPNEKGRRNSLLKMAENLVLKGIDIDAVNDDGESGLFDAIRNNSYDICAFFLNQTSQVNIQNNALETPLSIAVLGGIEYLDIILLLLNHGADARIKDEKGRSLLELLNDLIIYSRGHFEINDEALKELASQEKQYLIILKEILQNSKYDLNILTTKGQPLFFKAILDGDDALFSLYLNNKFDINQLDSNNLNIFYVYIFTVFSVNEYFDTFKGIIISMIRNGANINLADGDGKTIFSKVINNKTNIKLYNDMLEVCKFNYLAKDKQGRTLMHHAILSKHTNLVKIIYVRNSDVINVPDAFGILPITYAALTKDFEMVKLLLNYGNVFIRSSKKMIPAVKAKFAPMVNDIDILKLKTNDEDLLRKINILILQIKQDFKVEE